MKFSDSSINRALAERKTNPRGRYTIALEMWLQDQEIHKDTMQYCLILELLIAGVDIEQIRSITIKEGITLYYLFKKELI